MCLLCKPAPGLLQLIDHTSGEKNSILTSGGMVSVEGHSLKFDPTDPEQGIFLIAEDSTEIKIDILGQVMPSLLMFELPSTVSAGEYTVLVRTRPGKKLVEGSLKSVVSVL